MELRNNAFWNARYLFRGRTQEEVNEWFSKIGILRAGALSGIGSDASSKNAEQMLAGKTINLANIQYLGDNCLQNIVCSNVIIGNPDNELVFNIVQDEDTGAEIRGICDAIITNSCSEAGINSSRKKGLLTFTFYDASDDPAETVISRIDDHFDFSPGVINGYTLYQNNAKIWPET